MSKVKWFSGGVERGNQAVQIINELLNDDKIISDSPLEITLKKYRIELQQKESSIPFILSRMNLDISKALRSDPNQLSKEQTNKLKNLTSLSNIRYGY
ncbi:bacteriocin immunity protein [Latilactobacillus curvatus]|uniref:SakXIM n=2 Tax=Latilactobacillus TaxID=2767885 RepID=Q6XVG9_LATSK|nr:bacteriocin immunity protein [Latilactobacillus curvatus]AAP44570.1 SakXIM [Latilactobacillus sakei]AXN36616.1 bacteriocin immunity protein [Latilactobacillus curvatus]AYK27761.1 SakIX [Latilactobacillus curvatus]MCW8779630.1 bacteriocin immunity protein [Latilactobacillus curvatus]UTB71526.1 hypothetical protein A4W72_00660 [Latilactobacillus curvatus]